MTTFTKTMIGTATVLVFAVSLLGMAGSAEAKTDWTDREVSHAVDWELAKDAATPADRIAVSCDNGIITLTGRVNNIMARDRAEVIAETVKGVRSIVNRIEVTAPYRTDTAIEEDVEKAFLSDPATDSWEITAVAKGGIVELSGRVESWQEKELATRVAKGVKGVKGVDNHITVAYETDRADVEIQQEISQALRWDAYVDDALIDVSVDNGHVTLTGTVGSLAEKSRARTDAWVAGVRSVDNSELTVKYWARNDKLRKDKFVSKSEAEIESAVLDALVYDPRVDAARVEVDVADGIATLRGTVDDLKEKRAAAKDADNVLGVWAVKNQLKVSLDNPPTDERIKERVADALLRDPYVDRYDISVSVAEGEIYLYGDVNSKFEKGLADDVASRQYGVTGVHNFLTVHKPNADTYDPYTDEWNLYDYEWYDYRNTIAPIRTDWEIKQDIERELYWSPFVDQDEIEVQVADGIAELNGTVDTWSEREAAEKNALEGGALSVDNDLAVVTGPDYYKP